MTDLEKAETERIACDLAEAVHSMNNLNKEQIEYLDIINVIIETDINVNVKS